MNNYEYIIASLPEISSADSAGIIAEIRERLDGKDAGTFDFVLSWYEGTVPVDEFYRKALSSENSFVREYFRYDLNVRNAKVIYLNRELDRPEGTDMVMADEDSGFEDLDRVNAILSGHDILARERGLDDLMWEKADELTALHIFDIDIILGFTVKLEIADRWTRLDEQEGRERFRRLVNEIRNNR